MNIGDFLMRLKAKHFFLWSLKKYEHLLVSVISILWKHKTMEKKPAFWFKINFKLKALQSWLLFKKKKWGIKYPSKKQIHTIINMSWGGNLETLPIVTLTKTSLSSF